MGCDVSIRASNKDVTTACRSSNARQITRIQ
jgi:hypothetical protein